ncbi:MAG: hypothetical protein GX288_09000 [Clostridiales bacterium]|jgi:hypothetical protein|nr:hypothetical protein [Clostridiales bacterium]
MNNKFNHQDDKSGLGINSMSHNNISKVTTNDLNWKNNRKNDEDLIIEDNTVYEIDRECYERLMKQKYAKSRRNDKGKWNIKR